MANRKGKRKLTDEQIAELAADKARGMTIAACAKKYGVSKGTVDNYLAAWRKQQSAHLPLPDPVDVPAAHTAAESREMDLEQQLQIQAKLYSKIHGALDIVAPDIGHMAMKNQMTTVAITIDKVLLLRNSIDALERALGKQPTVRIVKPKRNVIEMRDVTKEPEAKPAEKEGTHDE
jgi:hypothetical protein